MRFFVELSIHRGHQSDRRHFDDAQSRQYQRQAAAGEMMLDGGALSPTQIWIKLTYPAANGLGL